MVSSQPRRVAPGNAQTLNGGADVSSDVQHTPLPLGVQCGGVSLGVGDSPVGDGIAAPKGKRLADVDYLGQAAVIVDASVGARRYVDLFSRDSGIHRSLNGGVARGSPTTITTRGDIAGSRPLGLGRETAQGEPKGRQRDEGEGER